MSPRINAAQIARVTALLVTLLGIGAAAQERNFDVHRLDQTAAGTSTFLVERPWFSERRLFAIGLTADYSHRALLPTFTTGRGALTPILEHALRGHLDLGVSLFDRVTLTGTMPVTFLERGTTEPLSGVGPVTTFGIGDVRVGLMVRLWGQSEHEPFAAHLGADLWVPVGVSATHQGDSAIRVLPRLVLAGAFGVGRWALDAGFLYRRFASIGPPALGMTAASEVRAGLAVGASVWDGRLSLGPEARYSLQVDGDNAFAVSGMSLELLGGLNLLIAEHFLIGVAGGTGLFAAAGTPDARAVVRLAWAPRRDSDDDGVTNLEDACPQDAGVLSPNATENGCPVADDADHDGVADEQDRCPFEAENKNGVRDEDGCPEYAMEEGSPIVRVLVPPKTVTTTTGTATHQTAPSSPDAGHPSTPPRAPATTPTMTTVEPDAGTTPSRPSALSADFLLADSDDDGVPDEADRCPATAEDRDGFEDDDGCPEADNDSDGIADASDQCLNEAETYNGFQDEDGCPDVAPDADGDGVADVVDRCPYEPENLDGIRDQDGCPEAPVAAQPALVKLLATPTAPLVGGTTLLTVEEQRKVDLEARDSDGDGLMDEVDRCPLSPEDKDGFEDEDGCPEPDNDGDGIADDTDQCREVAETVNGWLDDDGCPDERPDVDGDGMAYDEDRCPFEPGDASDGCPHVQAPKLAVAPFPVSSRAVAGAVEAPSAVADAAPLAPADFDRDGINDDADRCPLSPEDKDGFEDEDGCPEPDNDADSVVDAKDKCPFEAETINGIQDTDGCPDVGVSVVSVQGNEVVIDRVIAFKPASATLQPTAKPLLDQVAAKLKAARSLTIEIQGHTDDKGNAVDNIRLSKRRAEAIRAFLVKAGVASQRLVANGYGPTRPRATNKTAEGREKNRRVEFLILGEKR